MRSKSKSSLLGIAVVALIPSAAVAEIIYSQTMPESPTASFTSVDTPNGQKIADNFQLEGSGPVTVRSVHFIGGYITRDLSLTDLPTDDFRLAFFEDDDGRPGNILDAGDFDGEPAFISRVATGGPLLNGIYTPFAFAVDLGMGITLEPATEYWLSITNVPVDPSGWGWARAFGGFDQETAVTNDSLSSGSWEISYSRGMWFLLSERNIPEPSSISLVVLGLIIITFATKTRSMLQARPLNSKTLDC